MADIILIPGLWLDGSSWDRVLPPLEEAGHRPLALTLPGMDSRRADRSGITLRDHVAAVVGVIDVCPPEDAIVLVGHSLGCAIGHAAVDARPERVGRAVYIGGFPVGDGLALASGFLLEDGELPLPPFSDFDEADLRDLDDDDLRRFRERAIPSPGRLASDLQALHDGRRYDVPVTVVATEFTTETLRGWMSEGVAPVMELARIHDVDYVDLPTGHWPQFTRPEDLARLILERVPAG